MFFFPQYSIVGFSTPSMLSSIKYNFQFILVIKLNFTSLPLCFRIIPWLNCSTSENNKLKITKEIDASRNEENYSPLKWITLKKELSTLTSSFPKKYSLDHLR